jgi:hypothetical protein
VVSLQGGRPKENGDGAGPVSQAQAGASLQGEHPKENGDGTGPVSQAQAGAESGGADTFGAIAERPAAVPGRINVRRVLEVAADHFRIPLRDLTSHSRTQPLVRRRQIAMYVARETTGRSLPFIGKKIGGRDHTTILHGVNVVKGLIEAGDAETIAAVDQIVEQLHTQVVKLPVVCPQVSEPHPPTSPLPPPAPEALAPMLVLQELPVGQESPPAPDRVTVCRVLEVTADHFGTPLDDLVSHRRTQPLARQRQVAMYVARQMTGRSLPFIAHDMGKRHHTTVLDGVRVVEGLLEAGNAETIAAVDQIIERLQVTGGAHD